MTIPVSEICSESSGPVHRVCSFSGGHPVMSEHVPGDPVVPAFLQLLHVREMVCAFLDIRPERVRVRSVKFLAPLKPECSVDVWLERKCGGGVTFKLLHDGQTISQGEIGVG